MYAIGYDIGSSSIKAALVDTSNNIVKKVVQSPVQELDIISRQSGWAEQHPHTWWNNLRQATEKLLFQSGVSPHDIKSIGIAYQMHGLVLVDEAHEVLRPAIIWCDSRATHIGMDAFSELGTDYCLDNLLNSPGNFTASKLKWIKDNEPETYSRIYKIMLPGDYIAMKLSGEATTTIGGLSEAILWNYRKKEIAHKVLEYYDIDARLIPDLVDTFTPDLKVTATAAGELGLKEGTLVSYRAGDQPNNALALSVMHPGELSATSGTSGVVYAVTDKLMCDRKHRVNSFTHVNYSKSLDRIGVLLCINGAGIQYSWIKHQIARDNQSYEDMERMVSSVPIGSEGLCILPFGNGAERMFNNSNIESHILNLEFNRHSRAHLYRASLEGVAFSFVHGINILTEMGIDAEHIRVGNDNMFRSATFASTVATLTNCQIDVYDTTGAVGAARASGVAGQHYASIEEAFIDLEPIKTHQPSLNHGMCSQAYSYWLSGLGKVMNTNKDTSLKIKTLNEKKKDLETALNKNQQKIVSQGLIIDKIKSELNNIQEALSRKDSSKLNINKLKNKVYNLSKEIEKENALDGNLKYLNNEYIQTVSTKHPGLSLDDLKLCYLIKMKLTSKEIASSLNISLRGAETRRYRLKKKLSVPSDSSVIAYLLNLE